MYMAHTHEGRNVEMGDVVCFSSFRVRDSGALHDELPRKKAVISERSKKNKQFGCSKVGHTARDCPKRNWVANVLTKTGNVQGHGAAHQAPAYQKSKESDREFAVLWGGREM